MRNAFSLPIRKRFDPTYRPRRLLSTLLPFVASFSLVQAGPENTTRLPEEPTSWPQQTIDRELDLSRTNLAERLDADGVTPEQRAILIESWLAETDALRKESRLNLAADAREMRTGKVLDAPAPLPPVPPDATPLERDIHEMENEILAFSDTLDRAQPTAEQRAIQIEAFLAINREALKELEGMKRRHAAEAHGEEPEILAIVPGIPGDPSELTMKVSELEQIREEASSFSPEDRAIYLESQMATIARIEKEISLSRNPSGTTGTEISPTTEPQSE